MSKRGLVKRILLITVAVVAAAFIVIQFFQIDHVVPPVVASETLETAVPVPPDISLILGRSCNDCHSNLTVYPWYTRIQPVGWFMKNHIDDGRRELNFSIFNTYNTRRKGKKLEEMCEQVTQAEMPLPSYLWIHRDAVLKEGEAKALCDWTERARAALPPQ
jgi:hypothetical protein